MRKGLYGAIGFGAFLLVAGAGEAVAQSVEVAGNVSIVSDYTYRGISQTLEEPAIQGGIDFSLPSNLYIGVWGSSINFGEESPDGRAQVEMDVYGGIAPSIGGFDVDLGAIYYGYPGANDAYDYNFIEVAASIARAFGPVTAGISGAWSPDFYAATGTGLYGAGSLSFGMPNLPISLDGTLGYQGVEDNDKFGLPDYMVWSIGATAEVLGLSVGAGFTGTNLDDDECGDLCEPRFVLSVGI